MLSSHLKAKKVSLASFVNVYSKSLFFFFLFHFVLLISSHPLSYLHLLTSISATPDIKGKTPSQREKAAEEDEVPNRESLWEGGAGREHLREEWVMWGGRCMLNSDIGRVGSRSHPAWLALLPKASHLASQSLTF